MSAQRRNQRRRRRPAGSKPKPVDLWRPVPPLGDVAVLARGQEGLDAALASLRERGSPDPLAISTDLRDAMSIEAAFASTPADPLSRARLLPATIEIARAADDRERAREASAELDAIAARFPALTGAATHGAGRVAFASGAHADAIVHLRKSCNHWLDASMPFEAARARHDLGIALQASGDHAGAALELGIASEALERLALTSR